MHFNNKIGYLMQHLSSLLAKQSDQVLQERLGIGMSQFKILMALKWNHKVQQRSIAEALGQTEASISRQIKLMHEKDLLRTTVSPKNRREHITAPTIKGEELTEEALQVLHDYHAPTFAVLTEKQNNQLLSILALLHEQVCQPSKTTTCHPPNVPNTESAGAVV